MLLRAALSAYSIVIGVSALSSAKSGILSGYANGVFNLAVGVSLLAGFLTPVAGLFSVLSGAMGGFKSLSGMTSGNQNPALMYLVLVLTSVAIVLLGPGAFSLDAWLFGRREIIIPRRNAARARSSE